MPSLFKNFIFSHKLLLVGIFLVSLLVSIPVGFKQPGTDQSVFLYVGQRVLAGDSLYTEVWDHKGPILYLYEILGLTIGGGSLIGVAVVQWIVLSVAAIFCYLILEKFSPKWIATVCSLVWPFLSFVWVRGGNMPSIYGLLSQFVAIYLVLTKNKNKFVWFFIGCLGAANFLIKPTLIGTWLAIGIFGFYSLAIKDRLWKNFFTYIGWCLVGVLAVILPFILYFWSVGSLFDFYDAFWVFNYIHANDALGVNLLNSAFALPVFKFVSFVTNIISNKLLLLFLVMWTCSLLFLVKQGKILSEAKKSAIIFISILFPVDLFLTNFIIYRPFDHYLITLIPVLVMIFAWFGDWCVIYVKRIFINISQNHIVVPFVILLAIILPLILFASFFSDLASKFFSYNTERETVDSLVNYLKQNSDASDSVLVWGSKDIINFLSERKSASRYSFSSPIFFLQSSRISQMISTFNQEIISNPPLYIVDAYANVPGNPRLKWFDRFSEKEYDMVRTNIPLLTPFFIFVKNNYILVDSFDYFDVYQLKTRL